MEFEKKVCPDCNGSGVYQEYDEYDRYKKTGDKHWEKAMLRVKGDMEVRE